MKIEQTSLIFLVLFCVACQQKDTFKDDRDGKEYKIVKIGVQVWMAQNLNYNASGSKCYGEGGLTYEDIEEGPGIALSSSEIQANCDKYGRLYDWSTAMALPSTCNRDNCSELIKVPRRGICPSGWHIPTNADWEKLYRFVDGYGYRWVDGSSGKEEPYRSETAGKYLKAKSGWPATEDEGMSVNHNGEDSYGFSALPGGRGSFGGESFTVFYGIDFIGGWWSTSEAKDRSFRDCCAYFWYVPANRDAASNGLFTKDEVFSVRCLRDQSLSY